MIPYKREKWHFLTTAVGHDQYTIPIFEPSTRNKCVPLFKTMMSTRCQNDCQFCSFRTERNAVREQWEPEELAKVVMIAWQHRKIHGLFLSSSVDRDPDAVVQQKLEAVKILRDKGFTSYIHLRLMPGTDRELIKQSVELADRVGINIEFPSTAHYNDMKLFLDFRQDLIRRLKWLSHDILKAQKQGKCKAGLDSQMVVGVSNERDKEILQVSDWFYHRLKARRVYYSSFEPVKGAPLEKKQGEDRWREYRLYQCSFLLQQFGFHAKDFVLENARLPLSQDPKLLFAEKLEMKIDVNNAKYEEMIKVPGIGLKTARKILENRQIKDFDELKRCGVLSRAVPFLHVKREVQRKITFWK